MIRGNAPFRMYGTQTVAIGASSAATSTAVSSGTQIVRLIATVDCHVVIGNSPTATTSDTYLAADREEYFTCASGENVAVIQSASSGTLYVTECSN